MKYLWMLPFLAGCAFLSGLVGGAGEVVRDPATGEIIKTVAPLFGPLGVAAAAVLTALGVGGGAVAAKKVYNRRKAKGTA